ncbi:MAG TPA: hypothetical protein VF263_19815, partial [Longimicrobiaceae bacterium]
VNPRLRVTPGLGLRFLTPVGPLRVDAAYNRYGAQEGPLFGVDPQGNLPLLLPQYRPTRQPRRIQFYIAVGQAF